MRKSHWRVGALLAAGVLALAVSAAALGNYGTEQRREGGRRLDHRLAQRHLRGRDARIDVPEVARRDQGALREGVPRLEGEVRAHADQQRAVHGADRRRLRLEEGAGRDARLLGWVHDPVHAQLAPEAQRPGRTRRRASTAARARWDLSCLNLDCKGGKGEIYAVPNDLGTYGLFYNKALFKKAGIAAPPKTYKELLAQCAKFKAKGILPLAYGDRDGYSTDNWVTHDYASYMAKGDISKVNDGKMKYADPKLVKPLEALDAVQEAGLCQPGCVDAREQRREHLLHLGQGRDGADVPVRDQGLREGARQEPRPRTAAAVGAESRAAPRRTRSTTG